MWAARGFISTLVVAAAAAADDPVGSLGINFDTITRPTTGDVLTAGSTFEVTWTIADHPPYPADTVSIFLTVREDIPTGAFGYMGGIAGNHSMDLQLALCCQARRRRLSLDSGHHKLGEEVSMDCGYVVEHVVGVPTILRERTAGHLRHNLQRVPHRTTRSRHTPCDLVHPHVAKHAVY